MRMLYYMKENELKKEIRKNKKEVRDGTKGADRCYFLGGQSDPQHSVFCQYYLTKYIPVVMDTSITKCLIACLTIYVGKGQFICI